MSVENQIKALNQQLLLLENKADTPNNQQFIIKRLQHFVLSDSYRSLLMANPEHVSLFERLLSLLSHTGNNKNEMILQFIHALCRKDRVLSPRLARITEDYIKKLDDQEVQNILTALERLKPHLAHNNPLRSRLSHFYESALVTRQDWPFETLDATHLTEYNEQIRQALDNCRNLQGLIAKAAISTSWQWEPNGTVPDFERWNNGQKCYKASNPITAKKTAIVHIDSQLYNELRTAFASRKLSTEHRIKTGHREKLLDNEIENMIIDDSSDYPLYSTLPNGNEAMSENGSNGSSLSSLDMSKESSLSDSLDHFDTILSALSQCSQSTARRPDLGLGAITWSTLC